MTDHEQRVRAWLTSDCEYTLAPASADLRALLRDLDMERKERVLITHKLLTCGVAADHPDPALSSREKDYGGKWDSCAAQSVRKLRAGRDKLRVLLREAREYVLAYDMQCNTIGGRPHAQALLPRIDAALKEPRT